MGKTTVKRCLLIITTFVTLVGAPLFADTKVNTGTLAPSAQIVTAESDTEYAVYPFYRPIFLGTIRLYQVLISPSKGSSCPMTPHCSLYGYQAFSQESPLKAFIVTADRLHRCGHDLGNYEIDASNAAQKYSDPIMMAQSTHSAEPARVCSNANGLNSIDDNRSSRSEQQLFDFASALLTSGEYAQAVIEFRRFLSYFPDSKNKESAMESVFFGYYYQKQYLASAHWAAEIINNVSEPRKNKIMFYLGDSYFLLHNYPLARKYLKQVQNYGDEYYYRSVMLTAYSYAQESNWTAADAVFSQIPSTSTYYSSAKGSRLLLLDAKNLPLKNPKVAGTLAIIPGMGYLYDGYPQTALSSFIVTSLFIWGSFEAFRNDNQSLGIMMGVLSFGWYGGNIYGSTVSADRKNIKMKKDILSRFNLGFTP